MENLNNPEKEHGLGEGKKIEVPEENLEQHLKGAELLETPKDGSFLLGLQAFINWVKDLLAKDK